MGKKTRRTKRSRRLDLHAVTAADEELSRRDAEQLAHLPADGRERVLHLAAQLPALTPEVLAALAHHHDRGDAGTAERVFDDLERDGLLRAVPVLGPGPSFPRCGVVTPAGAAALADALGTDAGTVSARYGLDPASVSARVGDVPETLLRYGLLARLASVGAEAPLLLGWRRCWPPGSERELAPADPLRWALPAHARLRIDGQDAEYLLLADYADDELPRPGGVPPPRPVGFYAPVVRRVLAHHATMDRPPPRLLVATETEERALAWQAMVRAEGEARPNAPIGLTVATWDSLPAALVTVLARDLLGVRVVFRREDA